MGKDDWNPKRILELSGSYWQTCTLHAGVKLGVFTAIGEEHLTASEVAGRLPAEKRAVGMLLNALAAMGFLVKGEGVFSNTPASLTFLVKDAPQYLGYMIMHHHHLVETWAQLETAVRSGKPVGGGSATRDDEKRENFLMGMFNNAMLIAPTLTRAIDLTERHSLLDLGGGPGTYAIHFCLNHPHLRATVYDLASTRPFAEQTIARFGLSDRIAFLDGDYVNEPIPGSYDVAWLSHILHGESPEDCQGIIDKTVAALEPGGLIMIHEFILNNTLDGPLFPALFSLNMLLHTAGGQSYSEANISEMLTRAGVRDIRRLSFRGPNDSAVMAGIVARP